MGTRNRNIFGMFCAVLFSSFGIWFWLIKQFAHISAPHFPKIYLDNKIKGSLIDWWVNNLENYHKMWNKQRIVINCQFQLKYIVLHVWRVFPRKLMSIICKLHLAPLSHAYQVNMNSEWWIANSEKWVLQMSAEPRPWWMSGCM